MHRALTTTLLSASLLFATAAPAVDVYRWVDKDGTVHYGDKPPSPDAKPVELPKLERLDSTREAATETPAGGAGDLPVSASREPAGKAYTPKVTSPASEETIRDAERHVTVNVSPNPPPGYLLVYYLDGAAVTATPTPSTAYLLSGVERGEHTVAVAAVAPDGRVLARSPTVTFYMQPPIVRR